MKYLCLVYCDEGDLPTIPDSECIQYGVELDGRGTKIAAEALQSVQTATTVRVRKGTISLTDGPFAETKEQLAGFYLIDAEDLDAAVEVAAGIPAARVGCVEVRPVRQLNPGR